MEKIFLKHTLTIRNCGWVQLCSALMKVKEPYLLTGFSFMAGKLKLNVSYKHVRKKTKVERAINLANTIPRSADPLRHLFIYHSPEQDNDDDRLHLIVEQLSAFYSNAAQKP
ncbi:MULTISPECIES: hypothetical protein [Vibrio]|uniref:hypothetical protein n=1 Tax=Vibrio TaxID=662 RepID=UPI0004DCFF85|nr:MULTISPECIES: hypothetical protein [Vibrio]KFA94966.1 hypothetical protein HW45_28300 [Vibrio sp. ER1A]NOI26595.1 hypothetical protein [Vibrio mediterranei]